MICYFLGSFVIIYHIKFIFGSLNGKVWCIPFKIFVCKVSEVSIPSFLTHRLEFKRFCRETGIKILVSSTSKDSPCSSTRTPWLRFLRFSSSSSAWTNLVMFAIFSSSSWLTSKLEFKKYFVTKSRVAYYNTKNSNFLD